MANKNAIEKLIKLGFGVGIKLFSMVVGLYTMRWLNTNLTPQELKSFFLSLFFTGTILGLAHLGIVNLVSKFIITRVQDPERFNQMWSNSFYIQTTLSLLGILLIYIVSLTNPVLPFNILVLVYLAQLFLALDGAFKVVADFNNQTYKFTATELLSKFCILVLLLIMSRYYLGADNLLIYSMIILVCAAGQLVLDLIVQNKYLKWVRPNLKALIPYKMDILQFFGINLLLLLASNSDRWFLSYFKFSDYVINGYVNIYNLYVITTTVEAFILPVLYFNLINGKDLTSPVKDIVTNSKWLYLFILESICASVGFKILSYVLMPIIDKNSLYLKYSYEIVDILCVLILLNSTSYLITQLFILKDKVKYESISIVIFTLSTLVSYFLLIPSFGHIGAAYASLIGFGLYVGTKVLLVRRL